ncbi:hypothetical protein GPJ56_006505 [Histomonas meleagridis]|uniref:uncharacterized protein n=1 Tax=Histomonas meleagridis TaxID=135588 RepID=UPI00355983C4|nr:hypothetical protein GPJ56_006505 [Histomonas meleagridis]KAH0801742.1 hypothetical protein GO595_005423 [Histomonas meleagridis]
MCNCLKSGTQLQDIDLTSMTQNSQQIFELFKNDVFIVIFNPEWESIYESATTPEILNEYKSQMSTVSRHIESSEESIRQLNSGWRIDGLTSYNLTCHSSRIYVHVLDDKYRLVVINRYADSSTLEDDPNFERTLKLIVENVHQSIFALSGVEI